VAVIAATAAQLPPGELNVDNGRLHRNGAPLEGFDGIKKELQSEADAAAAGHGLSPDERPTLTQAVARYAKKPSELAHLPEISSEEAFGE
jgi:hypothetical protein